MRSDHELAYDVVTQLEWEPSVNDANIKVSATHGVIKLSGHVSSCAEKHDAEVAAKRVVGVCTVVNELAVTLPMTCSDEEIALACRGALKSHATVPDEHVRALVSHGWVTLEGTVEWRFQRDAAEVAIRNLIGVAGITNALAVVPRSSAADAKRQIEAAFKRSAAIDSQHITIELLDGNVVLQGKVRSWAELYEVEVAAWAAPGVSHVINELVISS